MAVPLLRLTRCFAAVVLVASLCACALPNTSGDFSVNTATTAAALTTLTSQLTQQPPSQVILLGEQHDIPEHQRLHHSAVLALSGKHQLAALAIEMAEQGQTTGSLPPSADEAAVRAVLNWDTDAWPWVAYGPAVMAAVRAGVPVLGANLARAQWRDAMQDTTLDAQLPAPALLDQQQAIRTGHCDLLPESQVAPMTRIQIARDRAMASTIKNAAQPGKTVLLLAGHGHVNRALGVPQHLPPGFTSQAILLEAATLSSPSKSNGPFDTTWSLGTAPPTDYCAEFTASRPRL